MMGLDMDRLPEKAEIKTELLMEIMNVLNRVQVIFINEDIALQQAYLSHEVEFSPLTALIRRVSEKLNFFIQECLMEKALEDDVEKFKRFLDNLDIDEEIQRISQKMENIDLDKGADNEEGD